MPASITESCTFLDAVTSGDTRKALEAVIERVAVELDQAEGARNVATLAKVLLDLLKAVERLPKPVSDRSIADELVARREERLTAMGTERVRRYGGRTKEEFPRQSGDPKKQA